MSILSYCGCSTNPVGEKSPTGFFTCKKREIQDMIKSSKTKNQRRISLMDYCIRKLLRLTEENFITDENWLEIVTENNETVRKIRIPHLFGHKTILDLKVQRFICKDCHKTWVVDCPLVPKNSNISYDLECQIMLYLKENFSRKTIDKLLSISDKTVERVKGQKNKNRKNRSAVALVL